MNITELDAIDVHVHVEQDGHGCFALDQELLDASATYFKADHYRTPTLEAIAAHYRARNIAAVVFTVDATTATGHPALSSEEIIDGAAAHADVLIPFASVDPHAADAAERIRALADRGARGFKFHPSLQAFAPNDPACYPLYEAITEAGVPALFHTGQTGIGAGLPGGRGIKLRFSDPMLIDDVAADFPELTVVLAHPSVPWQDAAISMATHKANVWIDLSGWSPKYFPPQLVRAMNGLLRQSVLFGSDYPVITPDRWRADFAALDVKDEVRPLILKENAVRMLGLEPRVVAYERVVDAPADRIFALIADPAEQPRWDGNDNLASAAAGQRVRGVGDVFVMTLTRGQVRENHVVEFEEGRRIAWRPSEQGAPPPGHLWRWELEPRGAATLVRHTYDWTQLADPNRMARARRTTAERLRGSVDRLAALAG